MILYGASGHAKVIVDILETNGQKIDFIVDDNPSLTDLLQQTLRLYLLLLRRCSVEKILILQHRQQWSFLMVTTD